MDPYGKSLDFVAKLLQFSVSPRSAWLITQRVAADAKDRCDEELAKAFADPSKPRLPDPEVAPPDIGIVSLDGVMGRIGKVVNATAAAEPEVQQPQPEEASETETEAKAQFREVKLGLVGHIVPAKQNPTRKRKNKREDRPTLGRRKYAVHLGPPQALFQMLVLLIYRLGLHRAKTLLVIADGAHWIWNGVKEHFTSLGVELVEILDYWHAVEHLWGLSRVLFGRGTKEAKAWVSARKDQLLNGNQDEFFAALERAVARARKTNPTAIVLERAGKKLTAVDMAHETLTYFRNNRSRINYHEYLARGFLIGSGAMEGACKHLVKERIHRSGMRWLPDGCSAVLRNRALVKSGDWDAFWSNAASQRQSKYLELKTALGAA